MGAWVTLGLLGWWRPERSWLDRLGRTLGFIWVGGYATMQLGKALAAFLK